MALRISDDQAKALGIAEHIPAKVKRPRGMNRTEARYAERLDGQVARGHIRRYWFEAVKFRLADRCWYCPDFLIELDDGSKILHEVKGGFIREDSWIKLKVAAEQMPFPFYLARWDGKRWDVKWVETRP